MDHVTFPRLFVHDPLANAVLLYFLKLLVPLTDKEHSKQAYIFCAPCRYLAQAARCCSTTGPILISQRLVTESKPMDLVLKLFWVSPRALQALRKVLEAAGAPHTASQPAQGPATSPHPSSRCWQKNREALSRRAQGNPLLYSSSPAARKCTNWQNTVKNTERTEIPAFKSSSPALCCHRVHPVQRCPRKDLSAKFPALLPSAP